MYNWILTYIPPWLYLALIFHGICIGTVAYLILLERKVASWAQDRIGPNRVGLGMGVIPKLKDFHFWGLGQPIADGIKLLVKEDYRPAEADKILFTVAPGVMMLVMVISIAVLPWGGTRQASRDIAIPVSVSNAGQYLQNQLAIGETMVGEPQRHDDSDLYTVTYRYPFQIANLNIGVLFILATLSLSVYGVVLGGWASNNKYSFLGGLRATVNMISYEVPLGLAVLTIVIMYGTLDLSVIVDKQAHYWAGCIPAWNCFTQPLTFLMFLVCLHAEANRLPFDLAEAEQELIGGYHTEYSSMRMGLLLLAEYAGMITTSAVCVALFFGGWHVPWLDKLVPALSGNIDSRTPSLTTELWVNIVRSAVFFTKTLIIIFVFMWVRWSLPRFRFDQLLIAAWRGLIPIALVMLMITAAIVFAFHGQSFDVVGAWMALALLGANAAVAVATVLVYRFIPLAPATNRRLKVIGSRFDKTPLPAGAE